MNAETVSCLNSLGLTEYKAKAVLALIEKGSLEAPEISRHADIPKTRVYDVLEKLEEKGLVIGLHGRPKKYQSIESDKLIEKLIEEKRTEFESIKENSIKLKESLSFKGKNEEKELVHRVKGLTDFDRILAMEILKAKKSVLGFTEIKEKRNFLDEALGKATKNKVKVQLIANDKEINKIFNSKISSKNSNHSLNAFVIDGKKIVLGLDNFKDKKSRYHFAILHNKSLAEALSNHFQEKWKK